MKKTGSKLSAIIKINIFKKITVYNSSKEKETSKDEDNEKESKNLMKPLKNALPYISDFLKNRQIPQGIKIRKSSEIWTGQLCRHCTVYRIYLGC